MKPTVSKYESLRLNEPERPQTRGNKEGSTKTLRSFRPLIPSFSLSTPLETQNLVPYCPGPTPTPSPLRRSRDEVDEIGVEKVCGEEDRDEGVVDEVRSGTRPVTL